MEEQHEVFTLIEEITRNDGTKYYEIGNMVHNGRAELAAERGYIKEVRILKLNIPHSQNVINSISSTRTIRCKMSRWITGRNGNEPQKPISWSRRFCVKTESAD